MNAEELLKYYCIDRKGNLSFKKKVAMSVEQLDDDKRIKMISHINGALAELACAYFLEIEKNEKIIDLQAWSETCPIDVLSCTEINENKFFTEVKYLGEIPEVTKLNLKAQRTTGTAASSISPMGKIYNYIALRIADIAVSFETKKINRDQRRGFIVVDSAIDQVGIFTEHLSNKENWFEGENWNLLLKELDLTETQRKYVHEPFEHYLSKLNKLILAKRYNEWNLKIYYQN